MFCAFASFLGDFNVIAIFLDLGGVAEIEHDRRSHDRRSCDDDRRRKIAVAEHRRADRVGGGELGKARCVRSRRPIRLAGNSRVESILSSMPKIIETADSSMVILARAVAWLFSS